MCPRWPRSFDGPKNVCDIGVPCCDSVSLMPDALFSYLRRDQ
jgi:hypothetical protein